MSDKKNRGYCSGYWYIHAELFINLHFQLFIHSQSFCFLLSHLFAFALTLVTFITFIFSGDSVTF